MSTSTADLKCPSSRRPSTTRLPSISYNNVTVNILSTTLGLYCTSSNDHDDDDYDDDDDDKIERNVKTRISFGLLESTYVGHTCFSTGIRAYLFLCAPEQAMFVLLYVPCQRPAALVVGQQLRCPCGLVHSCANTDCQHWLSAGQRELHNDIA